MSETQQESSAGSRIVFLAIVLILAIVLGRCDGTGRQLQSDIAAFSRADKSTFVVALKTLSQRASENPSRLQWGSTSLFKSKPKLSPSATLADFYRRITAVDEANRDRTIDEIRTELKELPKLEVKPTFWQEVVAAMADDDD